MKAKYSRALWVIVLLVVVALISWRLLPSKPEPLWKGKSLSEWTAQLDIFDSRAEVTAEAAILNIGPQAVPYLVRDLRKKDNWHAAGWIWFYGKLPPSLQGRFRRPIPPHELRYHSAHGLELLGVTATNAIPDLIAALDDRDSWVRIGAITALGAVGPAAREVTPRLVAGLKNSDRNHRLSCLIALKNMYRGSEAMDRVFLSLLEDTDSNFRAHASEALAHSPSQSPEFVAGLIAALKDAQPQGRGQAALALGQKPEHAAVSVPPLLKALKEAEADSTNSDSVIVMWKIIEALGEIGPAATPAVPALTNLLDSKISIVGTLSAIAWTKIHTNNATAIKYLIKKLETGEPGDQFWAAWQLGRCGEAAREALPVLETLVKQRPGDRNLQIMIAAALWRIDPSRPNPTQRILQLLGGHIGKYSGYETIRLLGELGPAAEAAVPALLEAWKSSGGRMLRDYAMDALKEISPQTAANPWR